MARLSLAFGQYQIRFFAYGTFHNSIAFMNIENSNLRNDVGIPERDLSINNPAEKYFGKELELPGRGLNK
jgi:hypothetical protein